MAAKKKRKDGRKAASQKRIADLIDKAIGGIETRLAQDKELTIGDYLKILQLNKELEDQQPQEVTVTWVDPEPKNDA